MTIATMNLINVLKSLLGNKRLFLLVTSLLTSSAVFSKIELIDRIVAVVDSGVVMESQLNSRVEEILMRLDSDKAELPPLNLLEEQVLDRLIIEEIQMQIAERAGIKISDSELNQTLSRVSGQNNLSLEDFRIKLESEGTSYRSFRDTIRKELIIQRVQRGKVGAKIDISEQEIENFINSEEGESQLAEQYNVQHILLSVKSGLTEEEIAEIENNANNRMAYVLSGIDLKNKISLLSTSVMPGTVQLTPKGDLLVVMRDGQVTGGYPRILQVTEDSQSKISQFATGKLIRFKLVNMVCLT